MIKIFELVVNDITPDMFLNFNHHQVIKEKWVFGINGWELVASSDLREWDKDKRIWISKYLRQQIERGGSTVVTYDEDVLVGFCCVDGYLLGKTAKYANLTMLFVDDKWQRKGVGSRLFRAISKHASNMHADKLFISAIPSSETVAFYFSMGCEDAKEMIAEYIDTENDRYLEYSLTT